MASSHSLHTLSISFAHTDFARIHADIAPFPAIENLVSLTQSCEEDIYAVPDTPLAPHLCRYKGAASLLPLVLRGSQPSHLSATRGSAAELLSTLLWTVHDPESITSHSDPRHCKWMSARAPPRALPAPHSPRPPQSRRPTPARSHDLGTSLSVHFLPLFSADGFFAMQHVYERLANIPTVPPALCSVVFRWQLARREDGEIVPHVSQLVTRVLPVNPDLVVTFSRLSAAADLWGF
jgi:hypothetical protein